MQTEEELTASRQFTQHQITARINDHGDVLLKQHDHGDDQVDDSVIILRPEQLEHLLAWVLRIKRAEK